MVTGKINKLVRDRGFGFITADDGREIFFHQNVLVDYFLLGQIFEQGFQRFEQYGLLGIFIKCI